jgi:hypothetical protein
MRLVPKTGGERGGELIFAGITFMLEEGAGADGHRTQRFGQVDALARAGGAPAAGRGIGQAGRRWRGLADASQPRATISAIPTR